MAMQQRKRRRRSGGNNNNNNSNNPNKHFESNGPEVRIRGSAAQILEKYQQYARDAQTSGDRVKAEALFQHAEHYARIVAQVEKEVAKQRAEREARDAERAAERATRDAERASERATRGESNDDKSDSDERVSEENEAKVAVSGDASEPPKSERRARSRRKPREDAETATSSDEKPKRTRRPKAELAEEDGVLKTISRGAEPAPADGEA